MTRLGNLRVGQKNKVTIMGILNVSPESFYKNSIKSSKSQISNHVKKLEENGADIIDVGGCSTRPGAEIVSEEEEWNRIVDVIQSIRKTFPDIIISVSYTHLTLPTKRIV